MAEKITKISITVILLAIIGHVTVLSLDEKLSYTSSTTRPLSTKKDTLTTRLPLTTSVPTRVLDSYRFVDGSLIINDKQYEGAKVPSLDDKQQICLNPDKPWPTVLSPTIKPATTTTSSSIFYSTTKNPNNSPPLPTRVPIDTPTTRKIVSMTTERPTTSKVYTLSQTTNPNKSQRIKQKLTSHKLSSRSVKEDLSSSKSSSFKKGLIGNNTQVLSTFPGVTFMFNWPIVVHRGCQVICKSGFLGLNRWRVNINEGLVCSLRLFNVRFCKSGYCLKGEDSSKSSTSTALPDNKLLSSTTSTTPAPKKLSSDESSLSTKQTIDTETTPIATVAVSVDTTTSNPLL